MGEITDVFRPSAEKTDVILSASVAYDEGSLARRPRVIRTQPPSGVLTRLEHHRLLFPSSSRLYSPGRDGLEGGLCGRGRGARGPGGRGHHGTAGPGKVTN